MTRKGPHVKMSSIALHRSILLDFDLPIIADLASEQEFMLTDWLNTRFDALKGGVEAELENDEHQQEHLEILVDEIRFCEVKFPRLLRASNFLIGYGAVESGLHQLATATYRDGMNTTAPLARGFYIRSARDYFESSGVDFSKFAGEWGALDSYRLVRNVIAHSAGIVDPADKEYIDLVAFINTRNDVEIDNKQQIVLADSWCRNFAEVGQNVVRSICDQLLPGNHKR